MDRKAEYLHDQYVENLINAKIRHCRIGAVRSKREYPQPPVQVIPCPRFPPMAWESKTPAPAPWWDDRTDISSAPIVPPHGVLM